jgi:uncharacterized membrane-anchored protein
MINKKKYLGLSLVLFMVLMVIIIAILYNHWPFLYGKKVILSTEPVDPFDPFKGQYMVINYEISRIQEARGFETGDKIFIILEEDSDNIWRMKDYSIFKPQAEYFIKGKVRSSYEGFIWVEYGIENFFFEKDAVLPTENITVEVAISNSGRARISRMLHNGKTIDIKYKKFDIRS